MVIYITGANGYLGNALAYFFAASGNEVIALSRKNVFSHKNIKFSYFSLGEEIDANLPKPDVCIHCAYDLKATKKAEIYEKNILGTQLLINQLLKINCKSIIYISSMSAFRGCKSNYGQTKLEAEKIVSKANGLSIRPGLIYGGENLGLMGKIKNVSKFTILPIIGNGNYPQYTTPIDVLCKTIAKIVNNKYLPKTNIITLASMEVSSLKKIIKSNNKKVVLIPIYWKIPFLVLLFFEKLSIALPFKSDSIKSLVFSNTSPDFSFIKENNLSLDFFEKQTK